MVTLRRRGFLKTATGGAAFGTLSGIASGTGTGPTYEIWAADQGTDTLYVYRPPRSGRGEDEFRLHDAIDLGAEGFETPHMVSFSSNCEYVLTANTGSGDVAVIHAPSRRIAAAIDTGPGSHFASFTPDDERIQVDVIGDGAIRQVDADLRAETFEVVDEIDVADAIANLDDAAVDDFELDDGQLRPICHDFTANGYSYHTLGPSYHNAGLAVVDHEAFAVHRAFPPTEVPTNCGTIAHPEDEKFYLTAGLPSDPDEGAEGIGEWYVFDTETHRPIDTDGTVVAGGEDIDPGDIARDSGGVDAHGFWFTETDDLELWILNRETNDGQVIDPTEDAVTAEVDRFGPATAEDPSARDSPDIMSSSPDDEYLFVTLRGPSPLSGDPHAATGVNPGFAVLDVTEREIVRVVQPDEDNDASDFHGIGVRPVNQSANRDN